MVMFSETSRVGIPSPLTHTQQIIPRKTDSRAVRRNPKSNRCPFATAVPETKTYQFHGLCEQHKSTRTYQKVNQFYKHITGVLISR